MGNGGLTLKVAANLLLYLQTLWRVGGVQLKTRLVEFLQRAFQLDTAGNISSLQKLKSIFPTTFGTSERICFMETIYQPITERHSKPPRGCPSAEGIAMILPHNPSPKIKQGPISTKGQPKEWVRQNLPADLRLNLQELRFLGKGFYISHWSIG